MREKTVGYAPVTPGEGAHHTVGSHEQYLHLVFGLMCSFLKVGVSFIEWIALKEFVTRRAENTPLYPTVLFFFSFFRTAKIAIGAHGACW